MMDKAQPPAPQVSAFEAIKHLDESGQEYWSARELYPVLTYKYWQDFYNVLKEAMTVYRQSGGDVDSIFRFIPKDSMRRSGRPYTITDYHLSRHACYLTVLSADGSKPVIALAKSYFAVATRLHELAQTQEDQLRLERRELLREQNKGLAARAQEAGVQTKVQFTAFWNAGYLGLYRETARQIRARKGITNRQDIGDYASSSEIAHLIIKASLARDMMITRKVSDPAMANATHYEAGDHVRIMLHNAGVPTPELLPTPRKSYEHLLREQIERERLAAEDSQSLWAQVRDGAIEEDEAEATAHIEFGVKITLTSKDDDTEILIESVSGPVEDAEYSTLSMVEPVNTRINLFWLPKVPDEETKNEAMLALSDYLTEIITQNEELRALYGGNAPLQP
jgi:DNA-damage-inducible protein D